MIRQTFRWFGALLMALGLVAGGLALFGGTASAQPPSGDDTTSCNGAFQGNPDGSLEITSPDDGTVVAAGDTVTIRIEWDTADWTSLDKILNCVEIGGVASDLSVEQKPTANDGVFETAYVVPSDLADGTEICNRARLSGNPDPEGQFGNVSTQKSNVVCLVVGTPDEDETVGITVKKNVVNGTGGESFPFSITCGDDDAVLVELGDEDSHTVSGLPEGTQCTIAETGVPAGSAWSTTIDGQADADRSIEVEATDNLVLFENTRTAYTYTCGDTTVDGSTVTMRGSTTDPRVDGASFSVNGGSATAGTSAGSGAYSATAQNVSAGDHTYVVTFTGADVSKASEQCSFSVAAIAQELPRNDAVAEESAVLGVAVDAPAEPAAAVAPAAEVEGVVLARTGTDSSTGLLYAALSLLVFGLGVMALTRKPDGAHFGA